MVPLRCSAMGRGRATGGLAQEDSPSRSASGPADMVGGLAEQQQSSDATPSGSGTCGGGDADISLMRRAAALRVKYRMHWMVRIPVMQIGAHPANRDGQGPSASRCTQLLEKILIMGFDPGEADSNGVLVEQKPGATHIHDANARFVEGDPALAPVLSGCVVHGTLSHSTLNQVMRNIAARCPLSSALVTPAVAGTHTIDNPEAQPQLQGRLARCVDRSGNLSPELLQMVDSAFADALHSGLQWEILSHTIEDEEPDGCAVIQSALNAKNGVFLVCHEMQALARLMTITASPAVAGGHRSWEVAQKSMRLTMPEFANDKHFIDLFAFVLDMGGETSKFLEDLKAFHTKFVNPQIRRLRLDTFCLLGHLPLDMPHLKVAALKFVYVEGKLAHGFCAAPSAAMFKRLGNPAEGFSASVVAEEHLRFFHIDCLAACQQLEAATRTKFFGNVDKDMFAKLLLTEPAARDAASENAPFGIVTAWCACFRNAASLPALGPRRQQEAPAVAGV